MLAQPGFLIIMGNLCILHSIYTLPGSLERETVHSTLLLILYLELVGNKSFYVTWISYLSIYIYVYCFLRTPLTDCTIAPPPKIKQ